MSRSVDMAELSKLRKSEFWRKKFRRAVEVRDTDKSGYISRADFELILERYRKLDTSTPEHLEKNYRIRCQNFAMFFTSVTRT